MENLNEEVKAALGRFKVAGIIAGIIMVILGICMFIEPLTTTGIIVNILLTIGLIIKGICDIVLYCKTPKGFKDGSVLALGIIWLILGLLFLATLIDSNGVSALFVNVGFQVFVGIALGVTVLFNGIALIAAKPETGSKSGWSIVGGILLILLSLFLIASPFITGIALTLVYGIFLIVAGIALFCRAVAM